MAEGCECCWIISEGNLLFKEYMWNLVRIYHVKIWKEAGWNNKYLTRPYLFLCVIVRTNWGRQENIYGWLGKESTTLWECCCWGDAEEAFLVQVNLEAVGWIGILRMRLSSLVMKRGMGRIWRVVLGICFWRI